MSHLRSTFTRSSPPVDQIQVKGTDWSNSNARVDQPRAHDDLRLTSTEVASH